MTGPLLASGISRLFCNFSKASLLHTSESNKVLTAGRGITAKFLFATSFLCKEEMFGFVFFLLREDCRCSADEMITQLW